MLFFTADVAVEPLEDDPLPVETAESELHASLALWCVPAPAPATPPAAAVRAVGMPGPVPGKLAAPGVGDAANGVVPAFDGGMARGALAAAAAAAATSSALAASARVCTADGNGVAATT